MRMTKDKSSAETAFNDIEFVMSECVRFHALIEKIGLKEAIRTLPKADLLACLPLPDGRGQIFCGAEAMHRIYELAKRTLRDSDAVGTLTIDKVVDSLQHVLMKSLAAAPQGISTADVQNILAATIDEAKKFRLDRTHFRPCRLMQAKDPAVFSIGPVTFRTRDTFNESMASQYEGYIKGTTSPQQRELCEKLLGNARHFYDGFSWIAEVKILSCDPETSEQRADLAVTAALDILHLLFGHSPTRRMAVGGPRLADDRRARFYLDAEGSLEVSCSSSSTSAVGFPDGWMKLLDRDDVRLMVRGAGKAIEPLVDPSVRRPMALRFTDAASWFGEAVREQSPAARVVKACTALEYLLSTGEREDRTRKKRKRKGKEVGVTTRVSERAAALCHHPEGDTFEKRKAEFRDFYDLRSSLVHGSSSPFDPEIEERCGHALKMTADVLCSALALFEAHALFDRAITNEQLRSGFEHLIAAARANDLARAQAPAGAASSGRPLAGKTDEPTIPGA